MFCVNKKVLCKQKRTQVQIKFDQVKTNEHINECHQCLHRSTWTGSNECGSAKTVQSVFGLHMSTPDPSCGPSRPGSARHKITDDVLPAYPTMGVFGPVAAYTPRPYRGPFFTATPFPPTLNPPLMIESMSFCLFVPWNTQISSVGLPAARREFRLASNWRLVMSLMYTTTSLTLRIHFRDCKYKYVTWNNE